MMFSKSGLLVICSSLVGCSHAATLHVSPTGSDSSAGTVTAPLKSIQSAIDLAVPGDVVYLRAGTYSPTTNIQIKKNGTSSKPVTVSAYGAEKVIIDGEALPGTPSALDASLPNANRGVFHIEKAWYWKFYKLELINGPYGIYARDSSYNYYEQIITRDNYETGFQLEGASAGNTVLYLDSYGNRDPRKNGESADGFACKEGSGEGNILRGARLWNNVDDGLDLWEFHSKVTIQDTLSWENGVNRWGFTDFQGDGNGFKLGGGSTASDISPAAHNLTNNFAFSNTAGGFVDNSQTGAMTLTRNTAWNNTGVGFKFGSATATLTANLGAGNAGGDKSLSSAQKESGNSWGVDSIQSVDVELVMGARLTGGEIQSSDFLLPSSGMAVGATTVWS